MRAIGRAGQALDSSWVMLRSSAVADGEQGRNVTKQNKPQRVGETTTMRTPHRLPKTIEQTIECTYNVFKTF